MKTHQHKNRPQVQFFSTRNDNNQQLQQILLLISFLHKTLYIFVRQLSRPEPQQTFYVFRINVVPFLKIYFNHVVGSSLFPLTLRYRVLSISPCPVDCDSFEVVWSSNSWIICFPVVRLIPWPTFFLCHMNIVTFLYIKHIWQHREGFVNLIGRK